MNMQWNWQWKLAQFAAVVIALGCPLANPAMAQANGSGHAQTHGPLVAALPGSKHTLSDGIRQVTKLPETPISAKFELDSGHLMLSVYTAEKGLESDAEHNVLKEYVGGPTGKAWEPKVEVFRDVAHVARAAQQQTLMAMAQRSLLDVIAQAGRDQSGTVFSAIPVSSGGRQQFVVLVASHGKVVELRYGLRSGILEGRAVTWTFEAERVGENARGFSTETGAWKVATGGASGKVLVQRAASDGATFNLALIEGTSYRDVDLSVSMHALTGDEDQGGGLVWRARDARNYYIARYNPLEDNYRVYKVVDGRRIELQSANIRHIAGWRTLRVTMHGSTIRCFLDGIESLKVADATFGAAGRIGLWTKADAVTEFDDVEVKGVPGESK